MRVKMVCPNSECDADYEVDVMAYGRNRCATRHEPAECVGFDVIGASWCPECGERLDTPTQFGYAIDTFCDDVREAAMERRLENVR